MLPIRAKSLRRAARQPILRARVGFDETATGRIALVATEMATNLLKHAAAGEIVVGTFADRDGAGLELLALDKGPGIADLGVALADGYSTAGSPGTGLGAVRRQCRPVRDLFASGPRHGGRGAVSAPMAPLRRASALGRDRGAVPGRDGSGDGWAFGAAAAGPTLLVVDGSGHGPLAARAAEAATTAFAGQSRPRLRTV